MMPQYTKNLLYSLSAFLMLAFGVSLQIKAGIGQSMFNAFSLILSELFKIEIGTVLNFFNMLFFIIYLLIRRSQVNGKDLIQIAAIIANGYIVNFYLYTILNHFNIETYLIKVLVFILGLILASFSLGAILAMEIIQFPLESLCILLGQRFGCKLSTIRMGFDIFFAIGTLILTLISSNSLYIREGTIISFFVLSRLMGISYDVHKNINKRSYSHV